MQNRILKTELFSIWWQASTRLETRQGFAVASG